MADSQSPPLAAVADRAKVVDWLTTPQSYFEAAGLGTFDVSNPVHYDLAYAAMHAAEQRERQAIIESRSKARHRRYGAARRASTRARSSRSA